MCSSRNRRFVPLVFAHFKNKKVVLKSYQVPLAVQLEHTRRRNTHRGDEDDDVARTATRSPGSGMCCCYSRLSLNGGAFADGRSLLEACIAALRARRLPATVKSGRTERERKRVRERERLRVFLLLPLRPHLHFPPSLSLAHFLRIYLVNDRSYGFRVHTGLGSSSCAQPKPHPNLEQLRLTSSYFVCLIKKAKTD